LQDWLPWQRFAVPEFFSLTFIFIHFVFKILQNLPQVNMGHWMALLVYFALAVLTSSFVKFCLMHAQATAEAASSNRTQSECPGITVLSAEI